MNSNQAVTKDSPEVGALLREHFPYFERVPVESSSYLDTAASALKLRSCVDRMSDYLSFEHANVHRGAYRLSLQATENYQLAREVVARFFDVPSSHEVIFTAGATDSFNLIAHGLAPKLIASGQPVMSTMIEHHSNFVPWQQLAKRRRSPFLTAEITKSAELDVFDFLTLLTEQSPRVAAFTAHSNAFGTLPPLEELLSNCKRRNCLSVVDGTQLAVHETVSIKELDPDFFCFSAHKLYGPTGLGVMIARKELLEMMEPYRTGGGMIGEVAPEETTWAEPPSRFEAGTPPIGEAIAFEATLGELRKIREEYDLAGAERELFELALAELSSLNGVTVLGPKQKDQRSIISFTVEGVHPHDIATFADEHGVQVRAGHHCVMPAMRALELTATTRLSFGMYSVKDDIYRLVDAIKYAQRLFH